MRGCSRAQCCQAEAGGFVARRHSSLCICVCLCVCHYGCHIIVASVGRCSGSLRSLAAVADSRLQGLPTVVTIAVTLVCSMTLRACVAPTRALSICWLVLALVGQHEPMSCLHYLAFAIMCCPWPCWLKGLLVAAMIAFVYSMAHTHCGVCIAICFSLCLLSSVQVFLRQRAHHCFTSL